MKPNTTTIFSIMNVVFWIIFIGFLIKAGAILISYIVSLINPIAATDLYLSLDLSDLQSANIWHYTSYVSFVITFLVIKAYMSYIVIKIFQVLDMSRPFSEAVSQLISKLSHITIAAAILAMIAGGYVKWLLKSGFDLNQNFGSSQFLFLAGIIFIIAEIFKRGIALQSENELTI